MNSQRLTQTKYLLPALAAAGLLVLSACGAATNAESGTPPHATAPGASTPAVGPGERQVPAAAAKVILPAVQVRNLTTGTDVDLSTLTPGDKPTLVWAWAPHCPYCNAEAPKVQEFSAANAAQVAVIGVGTQDSLDEAQDFVSKHELTTPTMVWDSGFDSWRAMSINSMPTWILLSPDGQQLGRWSGQFPEPQIATAIG